MTVATNYYDKIIIDEKRGTVEGYHLDHGTRLPIINARLENAQDDLSALIDNDLSTFWYNRNDKKRTSVIFDLGDTQLIKAIKLKHFDQYNGKIDVTLRTPRLKVEVGNGQDFTTVFEDIVGSINWLQTVNLPETSGQYLKLSLIENHKGNSSGTTNDFGFYEVEIWGNQAETSPQLFSDFEHKPSEALAPGWQVSASTDTTASIINQSGNRVLQLED
ncbi:discoidin domain-containing protein [Endozoicomonas sp. SCSIO W0465]|uniref:discoidin domain-containing protein n=1 Tax=Endozoicomonas sp. SCSIO W0465 TaxID=2918516 RepID=UPI00207594DF|nr:discoidin domain-containing protein [Endozoicomonas sp. SCSIO W0465]USE38848.1 discoidin domain-containing protein [Endozoicomonas sp. SCSIO W0465]